jgi:oleandomycin transport system permease protein
VNDSATMLRRNLLHMKRYPVLTLMVIGLPIIFLLLFVYVFGGALGDGSRHDYLQFLVPGLLAQGIAMGSIALGQNLNADIEKGVFDRFRSLPIARSAPLVGAVLADFFRYLILCVIYLGFGYVLGFRVETGMLPAIGAVALSIAFALSFCWISVWVGMVARSSGAVQGIMFLMIFPLAFGSNVYVDPSTMPGWLQGFVHVNPMSQLAGAVRGLTIGGTTASHVAWTLLWMAILLAVFVPLALRAYRRRA